jgi:hypothetical protein
MGMLVDEDDVFDYIIKNEISDISISSLKAVFKNVGGLDIANQYEKGKSDIIKEFLARLEKQIQEEFCTSLEYGITVYDIEKIAEEMGVFLE